MLRVGRDTIASSQDVKVGREGRDQRREGRVNDQGWKGDGGVQEGGAKGGRRGEEGSK